MRLLQRGRVTVLCRGHEMRAAVRPVSGLLSALRYGEYVQDMLRLLLPWNTEIFPGDRVTVDGAPYVCVLTRCLTGHVQADLRRCAR
ncbi:MAG: hypothetical protein IKP32_00710 [Clostridia bacterium]|nr:hypothetical protein [Clostridia bacterium]